MTAKELSKLIGQVGEWTVNAGAGIKVEVRVNDARIMFGRTDLLIMPVCGSGELWVDSQFVENLHSSS